MIIQNGTIEFKTQVEGAIDPETGYRSQPASASWSEALPANIQVVEVNQLAQALGGEHFTEKSYEVYLEEDTPILSERFRLKDITGKLLGEFSISQVVPLEAICMKCIKV